MDKKNTKYLSIIVSFILVFGSLAPVLVLTAQAQKVYIPSWIKQNAGLWSEGQIGDESFVQGLQYLIKEDILQIPETRTETKTSQVILSWIKQNAGWWSDGQITDESFVNGIQWLVKNGIIVVETTPQVEPKIIVERGKPIDFGLPPITTAPFPRLPEPPEKFKFTIGKNFFPSFRGFDFKPPLILKPPIQIQEACWSADSRDNPLAFLFVSNVHDVPSVKRYFLTGEPVDDGVFFEAGSAQSTGGQRFVGFMTFGMNNYLYSADGGVGQVLRYDGAGLPHGGEVFVSRSDNGGLVGIGGMAFGPDCNLYIGSRLTDEIKRYDGQTGEFLGNFVSTGLQKPVDLRFGPNGHLYVLNEISGEIIEYDLNGNALNNPLIVLPTNPLHYPVSLAIDEEGNLFVSIGKQIEKFDSNGNPLGSPLNPQNNSVFVSEGSGGLDRPTYMAFGPDDMLYVGDPNNKEIKRFNKHTGEFIDSFITAESGQLNGFHDIIFGILPKVPFTQVYLPDENVSGAKVYRAYHFSGDTFRVICQEPCNLDEETIYALYWGFKKAHKLTVDFMGGVDVPAKSLPVDIHVNDDDTCIEYIPGQASGYYSFYPLGPSQWTDKPFLCLYYVEKAATAVTFNVPRFAAFVPENFVQLWIHLLTVHEYSHVILHDLLRPYIISENIVKPASFYVAGRVNWDFTNDSLVGVRYVTDPCDPMLGSEYSGKIIFELCTQFGMTYVDFRQSISQLDNLRNSQGHATTVEDWKLILDDILDVDTTQAFLDSGYVI